MTNVTTKNTTDLTTDFNLSDHLTELETLSFEICVDSPPIHYKALQLAGHITLSLYDDGQATFDFDKDTGTYFDVKWTPDISEIVTEWHNVTAVELFSALHRNRWR